MNGPLDVVTLERRIRDYFADCSRGDAAAIARNFTEDAIHYFPAGAPQGTLRGARVIGETWARFVAEMGSSWTVDHVLVDVARLEAVIEWTHLKPGIGSYLRGDEWYRFTEAGLITEIRAYYACPASPGSSQPHELGGFPYAARGYPVSQAVEQR